MLSKWPMFCHIDFFRKKNIVCASALQYALYHYNKFKISNNLPDTGGNINMSDGQIEIIYSPST